MATNNGRNSQYTRFNVQQRAAEVSKIQMELSAFSLSWRQHPGRMFAGCRYNSVRLDCTKKAASPGVHFARNADGNLGKKAYTGWLSGHTYTGSFGTDHGSQESSGRENPVLLGRLRAKRTAAAQGGDPNIKTCQQAVVPENF